jgi:hypothetical protein
MGEEPYSTLTLYFGPAEQTLIPNKTGTGIRNAVDKQEYHFPRTELNSFVAAIEAMESQHKEYIYLKRNVGVGLNWNIKLL